MGSEGPRGNGGRGQGGEAGRRGGDNWCWERASETGLFPHPLFMAWAMCKLWSVALFIGWRRREGEEQRDRQEDREIHSVIVESERTRLVLLQDSVGSAQA